MKRFSSLLILPFLAWSGTSQARDVVEASAPTDLAVTVYRDPYRGQGGQMNANFPRGFAMISETRTVTLPAGESTIRFSGVSEGMVAVSAIVTGLPGGTIEKNRNADLLSPAALVDGTLGNRVTITRTNPGTGEEVSEDAIVRTRADGGLVLQTGDGFEAVRCSGLPERLTFDFLPEGLSPQPVFTIDTRDESGGTYEVTLTYLSWGFDWQADYVATLGGGEGSDEVELGLLSWLTILNDNGQSFENAELMAVAGTLNMVSNLQQLAQPPRARALQLTCYPLGSSLTGSPIPNYDVLPPPPAPMAMAAEGAIVVTGQRIERRDFEANSPMVTIDEDMLAQEEQLGDLKLYRIPQAVDVRAQGLKQVAFLLKDEVEGRYVYRDYCEASNPRHGTAFSNTQIIYATVNDEDHGLGVALPSGAIAFFEPSSVGDLLVGEENLRDYADGQDVEIDLGFSDQVMARCERVTTFNINEKGRWSRMRSTLTNANPHPVTVRLLLGSPGNWDFQDIGDELKDGQRVVEVSVPANGEREVEWRVRPALAD